MMSGCVVEHAGHPYIMPNYEDDPWVWLSPRTASRMPMRFGDTILYQPHKKGGRWVAEHMDNTPEHLWGCDPSVWYDGTVQKVLDTYLFIEPILTNHRRFRGPNVMCLPSAYPRGSRRPYVNQKVQYRAGPSEKPDAKYLQAIQVKPELLWHIL